MKSVITLVVLCMMLVTASCGDNNNSGDNPNTVELSRDNKQETPKGIKIFSKNSIDQTTLRLIDEGWNGAEVDARRSFYINQLDARGYEVYKPVDPCIPSPEQGIPSFRIRGDNYDGSEYDQYNPQGVGVRDGIGVVLAAEYVRSHGYVGGTKTIVVCFDNSVVSEASRNGFEHIIIFHNDFNYYIATQTHGIQGHPLLPQTTPRNPTKIVGVEAVYDPDQPVPSTASRKLPVDVVAVSDKEIARIVK